MNQFLYLLGRTPELAVLELRSLIPDHSCVELTPTVYRVELAEDEATATFHRLGGAVKLARVLATVPELTPAALVPLLLPEITSGRFTFGISAPQAGVSLPADLLRMIKEILTEQGISSRFVTHAEDEMLSSVIVATQSVTELVIIRVDDRYTVGRTVAVQDYAEWNSRDYERPRSDPKAGMLPPKVSRMAVNIAVGADTAGKLVVDPFCGMGTVLAEAYLSGCRVVGCDIAADAVEGAQKNMEWLQRKYGDRGAIPVHLADATHLSDVLSPSSVDAIVTEPFMGSTKYALQSPPPETVKRVITGLERLYQGCLKDWWEVLRPGGVVMMALPEYSVNGRKYFVKKIVDSCENFGYTILAGPIEYSRPQATVKRLFYKFRRLPKKANSRIIPAED